MALAGLKDPTHEELVARFRAVLDRHRGHDQAIMLPDLAAAIGLGRTPRDTRLVQEIRRELVQKHRVPVGSSCRKGESGYFLASETELQTTIRNYERRRDSLTTIIKTMKGLFRQEPVEQLPMFEEG